MSDRINGIPAPPLLLYDGDCGFCARSLSWLYAKARPELPAWRYQSVRLDHYGVTAARATREMLWVGRDGEIAGGVRAFAALLRTGRRPWSTIGRLLDTAPVRWIGHPVYRLIARHRHRLPGGTEACAMRITP